MKVTLFKDSVNECVYELDQVLSLVDLDEQYDDMLVTFDLSGITLEYISTHNGLVLDSAYIVDGGYAFLDVENFDIPEINTKAERLIYEYYYGGVK